MINKKTFPVAIICLIFIVAFFFSCISTVHAANRVALVIGNSGYSNSPLKNPRNDARDMAEVLQEIGFDVILRIDVSKRKIEEVMNGFYRKLQKAEVGFFFYAGHGMQIDGVNYLIPVDAYVENASDIKYEAVPVGRILGKMKDAGNKLNIVVLDACRDNPFRSYFRSGNKGLAFMEAPNGTVIAYATSPGSFAADGSGENSLYTGRLLSNLKKPELSVLQVFNQTGLDVRKITAGKQTPWLSSSPLEPFYLAGGNVEDRDSEPLPVTKESNLEISSSSSGSTVYIDDKPAEEKQTIIRKGWLTVSPEPSFARVRILNIIPRYRNDMALAPGSYHIEVSAVGYETKKQWVVLAAGDALDVVVFLHKQKKLGQIPPPPKRGQTPIGFPEVKWLEKTNVQHRILNERKMKVIRIP